MATKPTLAARFCADPEAMMFEAPYNAMQTVGVDGTAEERKAEAIRLREESAADDAASDRAERYATSSAYDR